MSLFVNIFALALPIFSLQVYDRVVAHGGISTLQGLVIGMILVVAFDFVLRQARSRIMQRVALRIDVLVGRALFNKIMALPLAALEAQPAAHWQALFRDVDVIRNTLSGASALLIADLPFAFLFLTLIFVIAGPIAWVLLVMLPVFMFVAWRSSTALADANSQERRTTQGRDSLIAEMIAGRATIKALALDRAMRPIWENAHADNIQTAIARGTKTDSYTNAGAAVTMVTQLTLTTVGVLAILSQAMTLGSLIATNMLAGRLLGPLNQLVSQWRAYASFKQSVERVGALFEIASERQESEIKMDRPTGQMMVEKATFSYAPNAAPVLDNVSVSIRAGGITALVGRNGSGKTTLLKMLQGLYTPTSGRVLIDGADVSQFSRTELAGWMGYVPQDCVLFAGTVRDNIAHRRPDSDDAEIIKAATAAGVHHFIIDMPDGYATDIGEAGRRLSGGQRQRIAIARAMVGDPPVLFLDEPSSSLDRQAEIDLRQTLVDLSRDHTVVIVTHSPILLAACDDLIALDRGKVALAGPSKEILPRLFGVSPTKEAPGAPPGPRAAAPASMPPPAGAAGTPPPRPTSRPLPTEVPLPPGPASAAPSRPTGMPSPPPPPPSPPEPPRPSLTAPVPPRPGAPPPPPPPSPTESLRPSLAAPGPPPAPPAAPPRPSAPPPPPPPSPTESLRPSIAAPVSPSPRDAARPRPTAIPPPPVPPAPPPSPPMPARPRLSIVPPPPPAAPAAPFSAPAAKVSPPTPPGPPEAASPERAPEEPPPESRRRRKRHRATADQPAVAPPPPVSPMTIPELSPEAPPAPGPAVPPRPLAASPPPPRLERPAAPALPARPMAPPAPPPRAPAAATSAPASILRSLRPRPIAQARPIATAVAVASPTTRPGNGSGPPHPPASGDLAAAADPAGPPPRRRRRRRSRPESEGGDARESPLRVRPPDGAGALRPRRGRGRAEDPAAPHSRHRRGDDRPSAGGAPPAAEAASVPPEPAPRMRVPARPPQMRGVFRPPSPPDLPPYAAETIYRPAAAAGGGVGRRAGFVHDDDATGRLPHATGLRPET